MILNGNDLKKRDILLNAAENYKKFGKYEEVWDDDKNLIYSMKSVWLVCYLNESNDCFVNKSLLWNVHN